MRNEKTAADKNKKLRKIPWRRGMGEQIMVLDYQLHTWCNPISANHRGLNAPVASTIWSKREKGLLGKLSVQTVRMQVLRLLWLRFDCGVGNIIIITEYSYYYQFNY